MDNELYDIRWRHSIDLGNGVITPGAIPRENMELKLNGIHLPDNLRGKSVLDIGAWDGFYSFECEKRGAKPVIAMDSPVWESQGGFCGFSYAKNVLQSKVKPLLMSVYDITPDNTEPVDIILFLGVIYHLKHPLLALENLAAVTKELLILESHCIDFGIEEPMMKFHANRNGVKDFNPSNFWEPNIPALKEMLKEVGFIIIDDFGGEYQHKRVTIHARK